MSRHYISILVVLQKSLSLKAKFKQEAISEQYIGLEQLTEILLTYLVIQ
jgi:hypothetical protein